MDKIKLILFIFANGDAITQISKECVEKVKEFVEKLVAEYNGQSLAMSDDFVDGVVKDYADQFPDVVAACAKVDAQFAGTASILPGTRGAFADLVKLILENQDSILQLINLIIQFTGKSDSDE